MPEPASLLLIEFLTWVSDRRRTYAEAMEAWRSTCPRHTVWEDALVGGLIQVESEGPPHQAEVVLTPRGRDLLDRTHSQKSAPAGPAPGA
jgi:hypothetical protein